MIKTLRNALKVKEIRKGLLYTFLMIIVVRIGCQLSVPNTDPDVIKEVTGQFASGAFGFFDAMTGGSFSEMSIFALNITPYITASIIIQLLTIAIPKLEEMQKDGEDGRKKIQKITRYITVALAFIEAPAMSIGFGNQGIFGNTSEMTTSRYWFVIILAVITMIAGATLIMWIGEQITEKGVGNGISIVLLVNIIARIPTDIANLFTKFVTGSDSIGGKVLAAVVIIAVILFVVAFVVILQDAQRRIPVQYSKKVQGRKMVGGSSSHIPLRVNTAGVIPVIFAQSLLQFPVVIGSFFGQNNAEWTRYLSSQHWCDPDNWIYSIGLVAYILLVLFFAYFYTSITFNPVEVANNMKKQGGFVPGIRPGKPTSTYLQTILNYIIFIGAVGLIIVAVFPILMSGIFDASVSFGGTSLIIIVGVVLETLKSLEAKMVVRNYKGFLTD
mgnify:CR=1 FL=1